MRNSRKYSRCLGLFCGLILLLAGTGQGLTLKIEGALLIKDSKIILSTANNNYGGATTFQVAINLHALIKVENLSGLLPANATISSCICSLYCTTNTGDDTIYAHRILKPWVEGDEDGVDNDDGDVTWNDWASDDYEWGTAGCACANDDGVDNNQDGTCDASGRDRKASEECLTFVNTVNTWYAFPVSAALAQDWYDGDADENGILLTGNRLFLGANTFASVENATAANRPFWTITYTVPGARRNREIRSKLRGDIDEEEFGFHARLDPVDYRQ